MTQQTTTTTAAAQTLTTANRIVVQPVDGNAERFGWEAIEYSASGAYLRTLAAFEPTAEDAALAADRILFS